MTKDQATSTVDMARAILHGVTKLLRELDPFCGMAPEDRMYHAEDGTWWKWDGDRLVQANAPVTRQDGPRA